MINRIINGLEIDVEETAPNELYFPTEFIDSVNDFDGSLDQIKQGIYNWNRNETYIPLSMMWEITNNCIFSCPFCYINTPLAEKHSFYTMKEFKAIIDDLVDMGMLFCTLSGGECLMQPGFPELYSYMKKKGVIVSVFSNGFLMDDAIFDVFDHLKPYKVEVSIYGVTDKAFKQATNTDFDYSVVLKNLLRLKKIGLDVRCKTPITNLTSAEIPAIKRWCEDNDIYYYVSDELFDSYYGENVDAYRTNDEVFRSAVKERETGYIKKTDHLFKRKIAWDCSAGKFAGVISGDKAFYPCMTSVGINKYRYSTEKGIKEAINHYKQDLRLEKGIDLSFCSGCNCCNICEKCVLSPYLDSKQQLEKYCRYMEKFI